MEGLQQKFKDAAEKINNNLRDNHELKNNFEVLLKNVERRYYELLGEDLRSGLETSIKKMFEDEEKEALEKSDKKND